MEMEHFLKYLVKTKQLDKISHINGDGMPNMKHRYIRDMYNEYLYREIPEFECSICLENIKDNMCKLNVGIVSAWIASQILPEQVTIVLYVARI